MILSNPFWDIHVRHTDVLVRHLQLGQGHQRLLGDLVRPRGHPVLAVVSVHEDDVDRFPDQGQYVFAGEDGLKM